MIYVVLNQRQSEKLELIGYFCDSMREMSIAVG